MREDIGVGVDKPTGNTNAVGVGDGCAVVANDGVEVAGIVVSTAGGGLLGGAVSVGGIRGVGVKVGVTAVVGVLEGQSKSSIRASEIHCHRSSGLASFMMT